MRTTRDTPVPPVQDNSKTGKRGLRCRRCGTMLWLGIERFCWYCGQRFVKSDEHEAELYAFDIGNDSEKAKEGTQ